MSGAHSLDYLSQLGRGTGGASQVDVVVGELEVRAATVGPEHERLKIRVLDRRQSVAGLAPAFANGVRVEVGDQVPKLCGVRAHAVEAFPRWSEDPRAGAPGGKTALLPLVEQPCPSCTSLVDGLEGAAFHLAERINLVVIAKTDPDRLGTYAQERGWRNLRLLSSRNNTFNRDYHAEAREGGQFPVLNVFSRDEDGIHHRWASEMTFTRGETSSLDAVWPIWGALDLTPNGRGDGAAYPNLQY